ncbi:MAG: hypothetical protein NTV00_13075 [Methylococcales bacterium]|nr:hypothetical protein [Methylococcales bacterium]
MTRLTYLFIIFILCGFNAQAFADYVKVSNSGNALPDSAQLGGGADDWACTYDDKTSIDVGSENHGWRFARPRMAVYLVRH